MKDASVSSYREYAVSLAAQQRLVHRFLQAGAAVHHCSAGKPSNVRHPAAYSRMPHSRLKDKKHFSLHETASPWQTRSSFVQVVVKSVQISYLSLEASGTGYP